MKDNTYIYDIYRLIDPRHPPEHENHVRYVGRTRQGVEARLGQHHSEGRCIKDSPVLKWFSFARLRIQRIETVHTQSKAKQREDYWINLHRRAGYRILNTQLVQKPSPSEELEDPIQVKEALEAEIMNHFSPTYLEFKRKSDEGLRKIEQGIFTLVETGQVNDEEARILLQAIGKA